MSFKGFHDANHILTDGGISVAFNLFVALSGLNQISDQEGEQQRCENVHCDQKNESMTQAPKAIINGFS
jgi:hypothetical protein